MKSLNENLIRKLSFTDFAVEEMEFSPEEKTLKIVVEGAWLDEGEGTALGRGIIYFEGWESVSIRRFDPTTEQWSAVPENAAEALKDICEVSFSDSAVCLCGFGKQTGQWLEWKLEKPKMYAEF